MTEINPEAQALIDRLKRMDPANPRQDKVTIERALGALFKARGLERRPVVWMDDARSAFCLIGERLKAVGRFGNDQGKWLYDAPRMSGDWILSIAAMTVVMAPFVAVTVGAGDRISFEGAIWFRPALLLGGLVALLALGWVYAAIENRREPMRNAADIVASGAMRAHLQPWQAAAFAGQERDAYQKGFVHSTTFAHRLAAEEIRTAAVRPRFPSWLRSVARPATDAFEAGLFFVSIWRDDVVCVLRPSLVIVNGQLHCATGPAMRWPSGEAHYFWRGVNVPAWVIEEPDRISVAAIRAEANQEVRRCMTEIYGLSRYLRDSDARLLQEDEFGRLWEARVGHETWRIVEVEDGTLGPDGKRRIYTLEVTDAERMLGWPIETARAAVAATYGLRPEEYRPEVRT